MRSIPAFLLLLALGATTGCNRRGSPGMGYGEMEGMTPSRPSLPPGHPSSPVRNISLPHDEACAPPGPGRDPFVTACVV
jgi:hypothetical protein